MVTHILSLNLVRNCIRVQGRSLSTVPLKIAFFGSDEFSVHSLKKLFEYKKNNNLINIDVITRSIKPTGRNLKRLVDLPIGDFCNNNSIPIHRADSSKDIIEMSKSMEFNLAIAVSYGRLIPEDFLNGCTFGGLNVHPSLLPKYSGSSPIQYALLNDDPFTGVTIQTLHPTKFDHGEIIIQTNEVPISENDNFCLLRDKLGELGGDLLMKVIDKKLYLNRNNQTKKYQFSLAPKISPNKSQINWTMHTSKEIKRMYDALGPLHTYKFIDITKKKSRIQADQKVILNDIKIVNDRYDLSRPGDFLLDNDRFIVKTIDGFLSIGLLKFQYCSEENPVDFSRALQKRSGNTPKRFISVR